MAEHVPFSRRSVFGPPRVFPHGYLLGAVAREIAQEISSGRTPFAPRIYEITKAERAALEQGQ